MKKVTVKSEYVAVSDMRRENSFFILNGNKIIARLYKKGVSWYVWIERVRERVCVRSATEGIKLICEVVKCKRFQMKENSIS